MEGYHFAYRKRLHFCRCFGLPTPSHVEDEVDIAARVAGQSLPPFRYRHQGTLATIGRRAAVVELGHIQLKGFVGWMFWSAVHIYFLIGIKNRFVVAITWLWSYVTFKRGARLITEVPPTVPAE